MSEKGARGANANSVTEDSEKPLLHCANTGGLITG